MRCFINVNNSRFKFLFAAVIIAPMFVGMIARNYGWIGMLSAKDNIYSSLGWSIIGTHGSLLHTKIAVLLVMVFIFLPWSFFMHNLGLGAITSTQVDAARTLGAKDFQLLRRLFFPSLIKAGLVTFFLIYCSTLGYFITPRMIGSNSGDVIGSIIMKFIELGDFSAASVLALTLLLSAVPFALLFIWLFKRDGTLS